MMELPFKHISLAEGEREKHDRRIKNIKKEKNLKGNEIVDILDKILKKDFKTIKERNYQGVNDNPFDLVAGDEETLNLYGFEIKGDTDNFSRLKAQLQAYLFCFNEVYLVLHKKKVPEWLPEYVGVIRVFKNGDVYIEKGSWFRDLLDISTDYEWDALFRSNGLGITSKKTKDVLKLIKDIRKNILFNRFFAKLPYGTKKFEKFYPFTEEQKTVIIGFDVPHHFKLFKKDITLLEQRLENIKQCVMMGQTGLKDFDKKTKGKKK